MEGRSTTTTTCERTGFTRWNVLIAVICVIPFLNTLYGEYTYDDKKAIRANADVAPFESFEALSTLWENDFWGNTMPMRLFGNCDKPTMRGWTNNSYRPLSVLSFVWDCTVCGKEPFCFHVTNLLIHFLNVLLSARLARNMFKSITDDFVRADHLGCAAALIFGMHPIRTEVVANITSRAEVLAANFVFLAMIIYFERCLGSTKEVTTWIWLLGMGTIVWMGVICKESALVAPAFLLVVEVCRLPSVEATDATTKDGPTGFVSYMIERWNAVRRRPVRVAFLLGLVALLLVVRLRLFACTDGTGYQIDTLLFLHNAVASVDDMGARLRTLFYVQSKAISMLWIPVGLSHDHAPIAPVEDVFDPRNGLTVAVAVLSVNAVFRWSTSGGASRRVRLVALAFIVAGYLPASHLVMRVAFTLAERTLFLPSFGASIITVELLRSGASISSSKWLLAIAAVYASMTMMRNRDWANEDALMRSNIATYPDRNYMSVFGLAALELYKGSDHLVEASKHLRKACDVAKQFNETYDYLVEDAFVLMSEMQWMYHVDRYGEKSDMWPLEALATLGEIEDSGRFKSLVMTNTGLLRYSIASMNDDENGLHDAERLVIGAATEESFQASLALESRMLALVYNNAACFRMLSPGTRWGHSAKVEPLFRYALGQAEVGPHPSEIATVLHNYAVMLAVSNRVSEATIAMQRALDVNPNLSEEKRVLWTSQLRRLQSEAFARYMAEHTSIYDISQGWIGSIADQRIAQFEGGCEVLLVWY